MTVGLHIHGITTEVGTGSFFHAFFSPISHHLEPKGWGSVYPVLMHKLYQGSLEAQDACALLKEPRDAREELKKFKPNEVIWDIDDLSAKPPWGDDISPRITDLSNYFVTSTGRDLFEAIIEDVEYLQKGRHAHRRAVPRISPGAAGPVGAVSNVTATTVVFSLRRDGRSLCSGIAI